MNGDAAADATPVVRPPSTKARSISRRFDDSAGGGFSGGFTERQKPHS
jgi:hypothetical protein